MPAQGLQRGVRDRNQLPRRCWVARLVQEHESPPGRRIARLVAASAAQDINRAAEAADTNVIPPLMSLG